MVCNWPTLPVRPLYEQGSFLVLSGYSAELLLVSVRQVKLAKDRSLEAFVADL